MSEMAADLTTTLSHRDPADAGRTGAGGVGVVVALIVLVGATAAGVLWRTADQRALRAERATAARVADRLDSEVRIIDAALSSAPVLAFTSDRSAGDESRLVFERYATELVAHTTLRAIAFAARVTDDGRDEFERDNGVTILDRAAGSSEGWTVAARRSEYAPVLWVVPRTPDTTAIIGFDVAGEPVRGAAVRAAAQSDDVEITQPVVSRPNATTSIFAARAVSLDGETVGWVTTAITAAVFEEALQHVVTTETEVTVIDGGVLFFGDPRPRGSTVTAAVGARQWQIWVDAPASRHFAALTAAVLTVLTASTSGLTLRRRHRRTRERDDAERLERAIARRRADRAAALALLGQRLSVARDLDEIVGAVTELGPASSGFEVVGLATVAEGERTIRLHGQTLANGTRRPPTDVEVPRPAPVLELLRRGDELSLDDPTDIDRTGILRTIVGDEVTSLDLVPLRNSARQLMGAIGFASATRPPTPEAGALRAIADLVAQTIERTQLSQQQAQVVLELQQHTLRPIQLVPGAHIAARYLPAARALGVGGDWYGVEEVSDHGIALVVGDVVGHGITAVVDMVEISGLIAAMARTDGELSSLPVDTAALFERPRQPLTRMATAVVCRIDTAARRLEYVRLGHPPAVLLSPGGDITLLDEASHPPVGVATVVGQSASFDYLPGTVLVLYTDGLIERRGEVIDVGLQRLVRAMAGLAACTADEIADALVARCVHGTAPDDIALVVAVLA